MGQFTAQVTANNPHIKYFNSNEHGYNIVEVTKDSILCAIKVVRVKPTEVDQQNRNQGIREEKAQKTEMTPTRSSTASARTGSSAGPAMTNINGGPSSDRIVGGSGRDVIDVEQGNDTVNAADGRLDTVSCGVGDNDTAFVREADQAEQSFEGFIRLSSCENATAP